MARLSRFLAVAVLLGGVTVSLSACTGDPAPTASPSPSPAVVSETPSPSPSPSPTALSEDELLALIPESAREENFGSAVNFARFFLREYDSMFQIRDASLFTFLSAADCEFCASSITNYRNLIDGGGTRDGGELATTLDPPQGSLNADGFWYVSVGFDVTASTDLSADGAVVNSGPAGSGKAYFKLEHSADHWLVHGVSIKFVSKA